MPHSDWSKSQAQAKKDDQRARVEAELQKRRTADVIVDHPGITSPVPLPQTDITQQSIDKWVKSQFAPGTPLDVKFEIATHLFVERAIEALHEMRGKDAMIAAGIAAEKMLLLRGLPTSIVGVVPLLIKIGEKAALENIELKTIIQAIWDEMNKK